MKTENDADEIFVNGDSSTDNTANNNLLHPEYNTMPEQVIPRRSSLVKDRDASRRTQQRKKTVSFGAMPNERTVINGEYKLSHTLAQWQCSGSSLALALD